MELSGQGPTGRVVAFANSSSSRARWHLQADSRRQPGVARHHAHAASEGRPRGDEGKKKKASWPLPTRCSANTAMTWRARPGIQKTTSLDAAAKHRPRCSCASPPPASRRSGAIPCSCSAPRKSTSAYSREPLKVITDAAARTDVLHILLAAADHVLGSSTPSRSSSWSRALADLPRLAELRVRVPSGASRRPAGSRARRCSTSRPCGCWW